MVRIVSLNEIDYRDCVEPWDWYGEEEPVRSPRFEYWTEVGSEYRDEVLNDAGMHVEKEIRHVR